MPLYTKLYIVFFITIFILNYLVQRYKRSWGKIFILLVSLAFYSYSNLRFICIPLGVGLVTYLSGIVIPRSGNHKKLLTTLFVIIELLPILSARSLTFMGSDLIIPLGISFFTLQAVTYTYGIYKGNLETEKSLLTILAFVTFFPSISSGPIQRAKELIPQLNSTEHEFSYDEATDGLKLIAWGAFKKLVIADNLAVYIRGVSGAEGSSYGIAVLLAAVMYSFQLYMDFSGYSDIAIGSARALGFDVKKNFDHPYLSKSLGEFWRRWHISLSSWLRDYVYIPLGGSRKGEFKRYRNLLITFAVSGLWHGAGITWIVWGLYHGLVLCLENLLKKRAGIKKYGIVPTFIVVTFGWIIFSSASMADVAKTLISFGGIPGELVNTLPELIAENGSVLAAITTILMMPKGYYIWVSILALIVVLIIGARADADDGLSVIRRQKSYVRWALYIVLALCILFFSAQDSGEFIYNRF